MHRTIGHTKTSQDPDDRLLGLAAHALGRGSDIPPKEALSIVEKYIQELFVSHRISLDNLRAFATPQERIEYIHAHGGDPYVIKVAQGIGLLAKANAKNRDTIEALSLVELVPPLLAERLNELLQNSDGWSRSGNVKKVLFTISDITTEAFEFKTMLPGGLGPEEVAERKRAILRLGLEASNQLLRLAEVNVAEPDRTQFEKRPIDEQRVIIWTLVNATKLSYESGKLYEGTAQEDHRRQMRLYSDALFDLTKLPNVSTATSTDTLNWLGTTPHRGSTVPEKIARIALLRGRLYDFEGEFPLAVQYYCVSRALDPSADAPKSALARLARKDPTIVEEREAYFAERVVHEVSHQTMHPWAFYRDQIEEREVATENISIKGVSPEELRTFIKTLRTLQRFPEAACAYVLDTQASQTEAWGIIYSENPALSIIALEVLNWLQQRKIAGAPLYYQDEYSRALTSTLGVYEEMFDQAQPQGGAEMRASLRHILHLFFPR